jgi:hypothetical protein
MDKYYTEIDTFVDNFKKDVKKSFIDSDENEFISFIDNYDSFKNHSISKIKVKNHTVVPLHQRCIALKTINDQCIRRKNKTSCFCGIHSKNQPFGFCTDSVSNCIMRILTLHTQDIHGIIYYLDEFLNIYNTEDVVTNKQNPRIIGKATQINNVFSITLLVEDF